MKKGLTGKFVTDFLLWLFALALGVAAVYFLFNQI